MSYRASGVTRAGLTEAELAEGWRRLPVHGWKASVANGASLANIALGNTFNTTAKFFSFATNQIKYVVSGEDVPFVWPPSGQVLTHARLKIMWGQRAQVAATDSVVWNLQAIQAETSDQILTANDVDVRNLSASLTSQEPSNQYAYKIDSIDLTLTGWEDRPSMFVLGRTGTDGADNLGVAAIVYGIELLVK